MSERHSPRSLEQGFDALRESAGRAALPGDSYSRLVDKLERRTSTARRWRLGLAVAAPALAALVALGVWRLPRHHDVAGFEIVTLARRAEAQAGADGELAVAGAAELRATGSNATITVPERARLRREAAGVRLLAGRARFAVARQPQRAVFRVLVSHGVIEVRGTSFLVEQGETGGEVLLETGRVHFLAPDGRELQLAPGQRLRWPLPAATPPASAGSPTTETEPPDLTTPKAAPPRPDARPRPSPPEVRRYLTEIDALRIRRDYRALAQRLTALLAAGVDEPLAERLSIELSDVLTRHGGDRARACRHLTAHLRRYPHGGNRQELIRSATQLECRGYRAPAPGAQ